MRLPRRFSIAGLMAIVLVSSFGLAALRSGSATWAGGLYLLTHAVLILAVVGAVCRGASERAWWAGFALSGLAYLKQAFWYGLVPCKLPTTVLLNLIRPDGAKPYPIDAVYGVPFESLYGYYWVVGHCLWSLLAATIGGALAHALFDAPTGPPAAPDVDVGARREIPPARAGRLRAAAVGLAGLATLAALVLVGSRSDPALWAGAAYLLTWGLLGVAALGFACVRGERRMVWFGAALFGLGYMVLNRGPDRYEETSYVHLVADQFLVALRPWLPRVASGFPAETAAIATENARIRGVLDRPIPMPFRDATALEDVLNYIRRATRAPDGREVAIYVDPIGLAEAEKTMQSPIRIDLEGLPLDTTLRLALRQLGMLYYVHDGMVHITSEAIGDAPLVVDYYLLLGHCVLAWLAAGVGAGLVPLVAGSRAGHAA